MIVWNHLKLTQDQGYLKWAVLENYLPISREGGGQQKHNLKNAEDFFTVMMKLEKIHWVILEATGGKS